MNTTTDRSQQQTWLSAIAETAKRQQVELPLFDQYGMGALRCATTATGRFVTLKRRKPSPKADGDGVEWAFWHQRDDLPVLIAAFRDALDPKPESVAATFSLLKGWLLDEWTPEQAKRSVSKHPGVQPAQDPPPQTGGRDLEKSPATPSRPA